MKIIINAYVGKKITGIGRTLIETVQRLAAYDINSTYYIYTNYDCEEIINFGFGSNVILRLIPVPKKSSILNLIYTAFIFPFEALRVGADIVYMPNFSLILFTFKPIVTVIHDMIDFKVNAKFSRLRMFYRHLIVPRMAHISKHIITVSENSKRDIVDICRIMPEKVSVVYNAVSDSFTVLSKLDKNDMEYVLYVGTVDHPGKNCHGVIKAFELYKKKFPSSDLKLVICGMPGKGFDIVEQAMINSTYAKDIIYKGYINDKELAYWFAGSKIFMFLSYYEGFGLPVLEAMSFGVPVIISDRSSLPEIAGDAALICDPDNPEMLSNAINSIISNPEFAEELVKKGYKNLGRFSWDETAKSTLKILHSVGVR